MSTNTGLLRASMVLGLTAFLGATATTQAGTVVFGKPGSAENAFPFGGYFSPPGDIYQQVYNAAHFDPGAMEIRTISFFNYRPGSGYFAEGDYDLFLSTTSRAVNALDTTDFDSNLGPDNRLFLSVHLCGNIPATVVFSGTPFSYDPAVGNLLLDVRIRNRTISPEDYKGTFEARAGDFGTDSSRAHNLGEGFESWGLVTAFSDAPPTPDAGSTLTLLGVGLLGSIWFRRRT